MAGVSAASSPAAADQPIRRPAGLRLAHVRALLWLAWKLRLRGYTRNWQNVVGLIFSLLFFILPISAGLSFATAVGYSLLDRPSATQLLFGVLLLLYVAWAVLPLLQYTVNEGLDVTKLQAYPVTRTEQMLTLVLATLFDLTGLIILGLFVAIVFGWEASPLAIAFTVAALALAYVHIVTLSQLLLAALMGLLRSRRYRDISIIVFSLIGLVCSLSGQIISRATVAFEPASGSFSLADLGLDKYVWWTPPGMAAEAIAKANAGDFATAGLNLAILALLVPVLLFVWGRVLDRGITTAESGGAGARRAARRAARASAEPITSSVSATGTAQEAAPGRGLLPAPALAITGKDLRYFWRDPQLKASLLSSLFVLILIFLPGFIDGRSSVGGSPFSPTAVIFAPLPALFITLNFAMNAFGLERAGAQTLFLFPVRPLHVFWGKNLAVGLVAGVAGLVATLGIAFLSGGWSYVPIALAAGLAAMLTVMGCGNIISVLLPFRVRQMRMGENRISSENGCLRGLLSMLVTVVVAITLIPVAAAIAVPLILDQPAWLFLALPGAVLYGALLHQAATRLIAPQFHRRAPDILAVIARDA